MRAGMSVLSDTHVQRWKRALEASCVGSGSAVEFRSRFQRKGPHVRASMAPKKVKYDAVRKFLQGSLLQFEGVSEKGPQYSIAPCREDPMADVPVTVPVTSAASEPSAGAVSSLALAPPASAPSPAGPTLPPGVMVLKLQDLEPEPTKSPNQDFEVDWRRFIGRGIFGRVYHGKQKSTGASVAVKTFKHKNDAFREIAVFLRVCRRIPVWSASWTSVGPTGRCAS